MNAEPKQVIIIRKDLNMRKGKMAAQAAHASLAVILNKMFSMTFLTQRRFTIQRTLSVFQDSAMDVWLKNKFKKICVSVDSEDELLDIYNKAKQADLPCELITDSGLTEFDGVPTKTCVAIGPDWPEKIDEITGHLKLL